MSLLDLKTARYPWETINRLPEPSRNLDHHDLLVDVLREEFDVVEALPDDGMVVESCTCEHRIAVLFFVPMVCLRRGAGDDRTSRSAISGSRAQSSICSSPTTAPQLRATTSRTASPRPSSAELSLS